ncbi:MAG: type II toxin-antitoxin system HigB family toxin [Methylococcales bacterium]|nr:type II toxin-antitoxin system HigB family toxin [Methylococcales bacterium]
MHIIAYPMLRDFFTKHPTSEASLTAWYKIVKQTDFFNFNDLKAVFPSADVVKNEQDKSLSVFNIHGNNVRLITAIHYNTKTVYIRDVLTHADYDKGRWK